MIKKEPIYRTLDFTNDSQFNRQQQATAKLLSSLKSIVQKDKLNTGKTYVTTKEKLKVPVVPIAPKDPQIWHLATFSSPDQLAEVKEKQRQAAHEAMLKKELAKFRSEVEEKFRASETNRTYRFPRTVMESFNEDNEETVKIDDHFDYAVIKAQIYTTANYTRPLTETCKKTSSRLKQQQNSRHNLESYFSSTLQGPALGLSPTREHTKKSARDAPATARTNSSSAQFFTKIRNLLHESNNKSSKEMNMLYKSHEGNQGEDNSLLTKTTLLKSMHTRIDSGQKSNLKGYGKETFKNIYQTLEREASSDSKRVTSCHSERKLIKSRVGNQRENGTNSTNKMYAVQKIPGKNSVLKIVKTKINDKPAPRVRPRAYEHNPGNSIERTGADSWRHEPVIGMKKPNPEYFDLKGKTIDQTLKSPSNKNLRTSDLTKLLSAINGKENSGSALYGSVIKSKMLVSPTRVRQASSIIKNAKLGVKAEQTTKKPFLLLGLAKH